MNETESPVILQKTKNVKRKKKIIESDSDIDEPTMSKKRKVTKPTEKVEYYNVDKSNICLDQRRSRLDKTESPAILQKPKNVKRKKRIIESDSEFDEPTTEPTKSKKGKVTKPTEKVEYYKVDKSNICLDRRRK